MNDLDVIVKLLKDLTVAVSEVRDMLEEYHDLVLRSALAARSDYYDE